MTKLEIARQIFLASPELARKDMIKKFVNEIGMTEAGASTYYAKIKSEAKDVAGEAKVTKSVKQPAKEVAAVEPSAKPVEVKEVRYVGMPMINGKPAHSDYTERFENGVLIRTAHGYQAS